MIYAELNNDNVVKGISELTSEVVNAKMIEIPAFDTSLMGKKWNGNIFVPSGIVLPPPVDPFADIRAKLNKIEADLVEIKADMKNIKDKP